MTTNNDIIKDFIDNQALSGHTQNVFIEGTAIYSYGYHFPMCLRIWKDNKPFYIVNKDGYSMTTARHKNALIRMIPDEKDILFISTEKLKELIDKKITDFNELVMAGL